MSSRPLLGGGGGGAAAAANSASTRGEEAYGATAPVSVSASASASSDLGSESAPPATAAAAAAAAAAAPTAGAAQRSRTGQQKRWKRAVERGSSFAFPNVAQEEADRLFSNYGEGYERADWARSWHSSRESSAQRPSSAWRIMNRDGDFGQSTGSLRVHRLNRSAALYVADLWHTLVDSSFRMVFIIFLVLYLLSILLFAVLYMLISKPCELHLDNFLSAWAFSLETIMTIGYAFPGDRDYFSQCTSLVTFVTFESILGVICDSVCVGLVFARLSRAQTRAATIVFSDSAVVRRIHGKLSLMFQVAEMRKHQLVEAHVRCYALSRHRCADGSPLMYFRSDTMRLVKPDDELGGMLFMAFPSVVVHNLDTFSPLRPSTKPSTDATAPNASRQNVFPGVLQRDCDIENGSRDLVHDAETPLSHGNQEPEVKSPASQPSQMGASLSASSLSSSASGPVLSAYEAEEEALKQYMIDHRVEIICMVEGIDAVTSDTIQARHSYCFEDIMWHFDFVPCTLEDENGAAQLDFEQFHKVFPVPEQYKNLPPMYLHSNP
ncbi:Inward rectifier potassium channel 2 [Hondaea fermentalgiana]|uniref:Inward rectifier potassium channel 2 n=1 Tax=Hondaea fermentalgiana TaxID=2315210 RepID=A0A2R5GDZ2_9STRA|nr:Inward rectifier potassium channel 2 [Hondaea fermentalgiana]|eukprot:GBG29156.1 Inward rectifier potassium channel 2 [Hondaea fermentalgiana]